MALESIVITIIAGIIATYGLVVMALWADRLGLPRLDFSRAMAELTYGQSFEGQAPYWAGQLVIYLNGIFFALIYATVVARYLPGPDLVKGAIWGGVLFVISGVFFVPLFMREGFFLSHIHRNAWITSAMVHGVWGLIVGWLSPIQGPIQG
jgi:hypothetical protein